jgi:phage tail sheath gpL-like
MGISTAFADSRRARGLAQNVVNRNRSLASLKYREPHIALVALGEHGFQVGGVDYATTPTRVYSAKDVADLVGDTSPAYLAAMSLFPANGRGVGSIPVTLFPLPHPVTHVQAIGDITPAGTVGAGETQTYYVKVGNVLSSAIIMVATDTVADFIAAAITAINGVVGMPVIASDGTTKLNLTAGWAGDSANGIVVEVISPADADLTFTIKNIGVTTEGSGTISIDTFTAALGMATWFTHVINCNSYTDTTILAAMESANELCWGSEVNKFFTVYNGTCEGTLNTMTAAGTARRTQRTHCFVPNPGANDIPFVVASEWCREVALSELADPAMDYSTDPDRNYAPRSMPRLVAPAEASQWTSSNRDTAVKAGVSTVEIIDGVVCISDTVTTYHPTGEDPPAYSYVCDIAKIAAVVFTADYIMRPMLSRPLKPDADRVKNKNAIKPKTVKSAFWSLFDVAGDACIISDVPYAKANSLFEISSVNPKRIDVLAVWKVSGNANVFSVTHEFGFYFGGQS